MKTSINKRYKPGFVDQLIKAVTMDLSKPNDFCSAFIVMSKTSVEGFLESETHDIFEKPEE